MPEQGGTRLHARATGAEDAAPQPGTATAVLTPAPLAGLAHEDAPAEAARPGGVLGRLRRFSGVVRRNTDDEGWSEAGGKGKAKPSKVDKIVQDAGSGSGNFGVGSGTKAQAEEAGRKWVGENYRTVATKKFTIYVSQDGLRQWRSPTYKPNLKKTQSNFESRAAAGGEWENNGHLTITD